MITKARAFESFVSDVEQFSPRWASALGSERRLLVLRVLMEEHPPISREELARRVAAGEAGHSEPDEAAVRDVLISIHHVHLPKLEDVGLVECTHEKGVLEEFSVHLPDEAL